MKENKNPSDNQKIGILAGAIVGVIQGLRNRNITAKPMMVIEDDVENYDMISLEDHLWKALNKCGIREAARKEAP